MKAPDEALAVVAFWRAAGYARWFDKSDGFDALTRLRLGRLHAAATRGGFSDWAKTPEGACALLILLDQAPRNLFRRTPRAFATDPAALAVADAAIARRFDRRVPKAMAWFFYLPFEHSENPDHQRRSVTLFKALGAPDGLRYAELHAEIIARFARFPHRNAILGRASTAEEDAFLKDGGFAG